MFANEFENRRVLVTGHTGFKGSWLSAWLLQLGAKVAGFALGLPSEPCNFSIMGLEDNVIHYLGDVRDIRALSDVFEQERPEIVFHLAAQSLVRRSYEEAPYTFETNVMGTANLLECVRHQPSVRVCVIVTSDKCYQNLEWLWGYRENDQLGGDDPYGASKACAELVSASYMQSFFQDDAAPRVATARAGNVIGGGDWAADRILPDAIRAWSEGKRLRVRHPQAIRPWQHALEPLSGYLWLAARLWTGDEALRNESFNFGPTSAADHSVVEVLAEMNKYWDGAKWTAEHEHNSDFRESTLLRLNCDKVERCLGWRTTLDFQEAIRFTSEWYKKYYNDGPGPMPTFAKRQLENYCSLAAARDLPWSR